MQLRQIIRRHPAAAVLVLVAVTAISTLGIRSLTSQAADQEAVSQKPAPISAVADSRYTVWQPGEYAPESEPTTEVVPALAPQPNPDTWSKLATLDIALGVDQERDGRQVELPAPAGFHESMNPFEQDRLLSATSVESAYQGSYEGPVVRVGGRGGTNGGVCR